MYLKSHCLAPYLLWEGSSWYEDWGYIHIDESHSVITPCSMILPLPQSGFSVRGVPIHSSGSSHPTFPSNPKMTSNSPFLLPIDSDTNDTKSLAGIPSQWSMVIQYGHPDQAWVREKMLCVAVERCWWGGSWPCCSGTCWALCDTSLSLSRPQFPYLYNSCPTSPKNPEERKKGNAEANRNFWICEMRELCVANWRAKLIRLLWGWVN